MAAAALNAKGIANDQRGFLLTGDAKFVREADRRTGGARVAIAASVGPDRALRKTYERSLASAQTLGAHSIRPATSSVAAASSRTVWILVACLPVARLTAILGADLSS